MNNVDKKIVVTNYGELNQKQKAFFDAMNVKIKEQGDASLSERCTFELINMVEELNQRILKLEEGMRRGWQKKRSDDISNMFSI